MSHGLTVADLWNPSELEKVESGREVYYIMDTPCRNYTGTKATAEEVVDKMGPFKTMWAAVKASQKRMRDTGMGAHLLVEKYGE